MGNAGLISILQDRFVSSSYRLNLATEVLNLYLIISERSGEMTMEAYSKGEKGIELLAIRSINEVVEETGRSIQEPRKNRSLKCPPVNDNDKEIPYEEMSWVIVCMIL